MSRRRALQTGVAFAAALAIVGLALAPTREPVRGESPQQSLTTVFDANVDIVTLPEASRLTEAREDPRGSSRGLLLLAIIAAALLVVAESRSPGSAIAADSSTSAAHRRNARPRAPPLPV